MQTSLPIELITALSAKGGISATHPCCVFLYILSGPVNLSLGNEPFPYENSDLIFLPPNRQFEAVSGKDGRLLVLGISEDFFNDYIHFSPLPVLSSQLTPDADFLPLKRSVLRIAEACAYTAPSRQVALTPGDELNIWSELFRLLSCLSRIFPTLSESSFRSSNRHLERVQKIADYIDRHCTQNLTLPDLANAFFLTPQYLSTFLHEHLGMNFKTYITKRRLHYAQRDLRGNDASISEIAMKNGFASVSTFQKNFQKYCGCTPSEYRQKQQKKQDSEEHRHALELPSYELDKPPGISVSVPVTSPAKEFAHVNCMINVGSVHKLLSERFRLNLGAFCAERSIRYVRITELFSNSFMPMILPHMDYFYQNADIALTFFYENGLVPFIELTKLEERRTEDFRLWNDFNYILRNDRFFKLLESFMKHISRRWPINWLQEWKFEMYLLPKDSPASYVKDFSRAASIIRTYIPGAAIGGPGIDASAHAISPEELLTEFAARQVVPDFFSATLHYHVRREDGSIGISSNPDCLIARCRELRKILRRSGAALPLYITEWFSAAPGSTPVAASRYQAAFIAKTWAALDEACDLAGYSLFDNTEYVPGSQMPTIYQFGSGLFASGFVPYASFHAYNVCSALGSKVIAKGNCWRLMFSEENHYQLLVWHYVHFQASTDPESSDLINFDKVYQIFEDADPFLFSLLLTDVPPGLYHTVRTIIDEDHGSIFDVLIGEYTHSNISRVEFLKHARAMSGTAKTHRAEISLPLERSLYTRIETGTIHLSYELPPHTVCLWDIRRLI